MSPIAAVMRAVGDFWLARSNATQVLLILGLLVVKNGVDIELRNIQEAYIPAAAAFPEPLGYFSASFGQVALASTLGLDTTPKWVAFHALLTLLTLVLICILALRSRPIAPQVASAQDQMVRREGSFTLLMVASATAASTILIGIGKYDVITVLGGFTLVLARTWWGAGIGAVLMASGNPEQAMIAALALGLVTLTYEGRPYRARAVVALGVSVAAWVLVQWWFHVSGMETGRLELIPLYLGASLGNFLSAPDQAVWSWLGVGWLFVLGSLVLARGRSRWLLVAGIILLPGLASIITADGARVAATVALPAYLAIGLWLVRDRISSSRYYRETAGVIVLALIVLPTVIPQSGWFAGQVVGRLQALIGG